MHTWAAVRPARVFNMGTAATLGQHCGDGAGVPTTSRAEPGCAEPCRAGLCRAVLSRAVLDQAVPGQAVPKRAVPGQAVPKRAVPSRACGHMGRRAEPAALTSPWLRAPRSRPAPLALPPPQR